MSMLQHGDDDALARCVHCGALAVGPCAQCRLPVCGDCCVLTEGGSRTWAICISCDKRSGRSLRSGWATVIAWIAVPILLLLGAVVLLSRIVR